MKLIKQRLQITNAQAGIRFDQALHQLLPAYSRSRIQQWIDQGFVLVNYRQAKIRQKVVAGDWIDLDVPQQAQISDLAQPIDFEIIHQDDDLFIVNKPAGLVVHPAAGHPDGTLVNGLLARDAELQQLPRAGIVHRLDKDTTGVMMVARNLPAYHWLVEELQARRVKREYLALAQGVVSEGGTVEGAIGRHPKNRKKMSVQSNGKPAVTHFQVSRQFQHHSLLKVQLETGRTHQIRVHMAHIHHPLLGDPVYGGRGRLPSAMGDDLAGGIRGFERQALHAENLAFVHPGSKQEVRFHAPLPADFESLIEQLSRHDAID